MPANPASAQGDSRTFPETGKTVTGRFLEYWTQNGGLLGRGSGIEQGDGLTAQVEGVAGAVFGGAGVDRGQCARKLLDEGHVGEAGCCAAVGPAQRLHLADSADRAARPGHEDEGRDGVGQLMQELPLIVGVVTTGGHRILL
jgi:hypothetical protein